MLSVSLITRLFTPRPKSAIIRAHHFRPSPDRRIVSDFGSCLPVLKAELGLIRAFLGSEINAILFGEEEG